MESPFFRNRRWYQQPGPIRSPSYNGVPAYRVVDPVRESHLPVNRPQEGSSGPKVVRIPVRFVGSEPLDRAGSAVKIQKVFRGFFVRKCLKKVKDVRVQVDEIGEKISRSEIAELLRKDERERLRMNEALMSLLFKLDSICGVDFGVRACRKAVTRKVIALQERIDAIVAADLEGNCEIDDGVAEIGVCVETENSIEPDCSEKNLGVLENCGENLGNNDGEAEIIDVGVDWEVKVSESNLDSEVNTEKREKGLMEKMMEESGKMRKLISEMCERNEMQTKMLSALTNRVEMLEKAFVCDRLRKKKNSNKRKAKSTEN